MVTLRKQQLRKHSCTFLLPLQSDSDWHLLHLLVILHPVESAKFQVSAITLEIDLDILRQRRVIDACVTDIDPARLASPPPQYWLWWLASAAPLSGRRKLLCGRRGLKGAICGVWTALPMDSPGWTLHIWEIIFLLLGESQEMLLSWH